MRFHWLLPCVSILSADAKIDFAEEINPIFVKHCYACHGGVKDAGGINFIYREKALAEGESGELAIVPGRPEDSELIRRVTLPAGDDDIMPQAKHGPPLSQGEIDLLTQWISEGAEWSGHWSFTPIKDFGDKGIDHFIAQKINAEGLTPSPEAPKEEWLRRVTLDLTGLLPSEKEIHAFLSDDSSKAYESVVDRLLESPNYGERWASVWLDLARYADSEGLGQDHPREVYPYRNWVIRAFQEDMPFTDFTVKQLAGDLLDDPSFDDLIATGFNRLTAQNSEGGTDDEEFRVSAIMDRVATTYNVWQGLTMECVQCHSHPYDPIQKEEYYQTMAFFNNTVDADLGVHDTAIRAPADPEKQRELLHSFQKLDRVNAQLQAGTLELNKNSNWIAPTKAEFTTKGSLMKAELRQTENGEPDFYAFGTPKSSAIHKATFSLPTDQSLTALRLTVLPENIEKARHMAEASFALKDVILTQIKEDGTRLELPFQAGFTSRQDTPRANGLTNKEEKWGWMVPSKFFHPQWAALILKNPLQADQDDRFEVTLVHNWVRGNQGSVPLVVRRFQLHFTSSTAWQTEALSDERMQLLSDSGHLRHVLNKAEGPRALIMKEREPLIQRETRLFERGNWLTRGKIVHPGTPESLPALKAAEPTRLDFAQWLISGENPLTARVWANRLWHQLFGLGLVETLEDFGAAGTTPSHPYLLDHLANSFMNKHGWRTKPLLKELVLSKTYRRTSNVSAETREKDPYNKFLSYGPRQRMTSEMVRDTSLQISGLLSDKRFGGFSHPPIPEGVWRPFDGKDKWKTPEVGNKDRYRRMIYTYTKREIPYPAMAVFDAPSREFCEQRRPVSNTPLQALMTMNDEAYFEAAKALAGRLESLPGSLSEQIRSIYHQATTTQPDEALVAKLTDTRKQFLASYQAEPALAEKLSATPEQAANMMLCNVILNLDEFLTR